MTDRTIMIARVDFDDPEEGVAAVIDRAALASCQASHDAVQALISLMSHAVHSDTSIPVVHRVADLDELTGLGLIRWTKNADLVRLT